MRRRTLRKTETMPRQIGVRLPTGEIRSLERIAAAEGRTVSGQIRYWVLQRLAERRSQADAKAR